jgi:hypothetical protein
LSDADNKELIARVIEGEIAPSRLVRLSPEKLASSSVREMKRENQQSAIAEVVLTAPTLFVDVFFSSCRHFCFPWVLWRLVRNLLPEKLVVGAVCRCLRLFV